MIPNCFKLDKGELCLFLDYRYLWVQFFCCPDALAFHYPSVLPQCSSRNDPTKRSSDYDDGRPRDDDYSSEYDRSSDYDCPMTALP